jgi:hypothetical protein
MNFPLTPPSAGPNSVAASKHFGGDDMAFSDFASVGSFVSSVAVVFMLGLLLVQTRQSNRNQRTFMQQGRAARSVDLVMRLTESRQSDLVVRGESGDLSLTAAEVQSYFRLCGAFYLHYEDSFLQFQAGTLDRASWTNDLATLSRFASNTGTRVAWTFIRGFSGGDYRAFVDGLMLDTKNRAPQTYAEFWRSRVTEELAAV